MILFQRAQHAAIPGITSQTFVFCTQNRIVCNRISTSTHDPTQRRKEVDSRQSIIMSKVSLAYSNDGSGVPEQFIEKKQRGHETKVDEEERLSQSMPNTTIHSTHESITFDKVANVNDLPDDHWKWKDYYSRLGMPEKSSKMELKRQFLQFALLYQPSATTFDDAKDRFRAIQEAYYVLLNSSEASITFYKVVDPNDLPDDHWKWNDPYSRLGMPKYSKETEITEQFLQFALLYQPSTTTFDNARERFRAIKEAYSILLNSSETKIKTLSKDLRYCPNFAIESQHELHEQQGSQKESSQDNQQAESIAHEHDENSMNDMDMDYIDMDMDMDMEDAGDMEHAKDKEYVNGMDEEQNNIIFDLCQELRSKTDAYTYNQDAIDNFYALKKTEYSWITKEAFEHSFRETFFEAFKEGEKADSENKKPKRKRKRLAKRASRNYEGVDAQESKEGKNVEDDEEYEDEERSKDVQLNPVPPIWMSHYNKLKTYKESVGNCHVSRKYKDDPKLGCWVAEQRRRYKLTPEAQKTARKTALKQNQIELLEEIGFDWVRTGINENTRTWMDSYNILKAYKQSEGNCRVPIAYRIDPKLGRWVKNQRRQYRLHLSGEPNQLEPNHVELLEEISLELSAKEVVGREWNDSYDELKEHNETTGSCLVNRTHNPKLAAWIWKQRRQYKLFQDGKINSLGSERVELLEEIGFDWSMEDVNNRAWEDSYNKLKSYNLLFGNYHVPQKYKDDPELGRWVKNQRDKYRLFREGKQSSMTPERIQLLEDIGFEWSVKEASNRSWFDNFNELRAYKQAFGHCRVPGKYNTDPELGRWVKNQRDKYRLLREERKSSMTPQRIERLEQIGFEWSLK